MTDVTADARSVRGRTDAFLEFYAETSGPLGGYAYQLVHDAEVAADIVQEAYTRLLSRWVAIRKPRPYLFHVVTNLAKDAWSAGQRDATLLKGLVDLRVPVDAPAPDCSVLDAVARLPRRHRDVVLLHYYGDLAVAEIAAVVCRPPGTVKRLMAEARVRLAETLEERP